ncbi:MAG: sensor histidine kinase [Oceanihabitans sp.]
MILYILQNSRVSTSAERYLLIYMIGVLLIVCSLIILFFIVFQKRKNKLLLDKIKMQKEFDDAFAKTNAEIQEQTLKYIGQELHDNVGQLLSVANMQLSILNTVVPEEIKPRFNESKNAVKESLAEVRALSKSLNQDVIQKRGFVESVQTEIDRLNRMRMLNATLTKTGNIPENKNNKDQIILFRILQEFIANTIKYSKAKNLQIDLQYLPETLQITATDDGIGFSLENAKTSSGLINMKSRAALIDAEFNLETQENKGVQLTLNYPILKRTK